MDKRLEQVLYQGECKDGDKVREKMFNVISHEGNTTHNHGTSIRMAEIKYTDKLSGDEAAEQLELSHRPGRNANQQSQSGKHFASFFKKSNIHLNI